jgi:hypothetical protein
MKQENNERMEVYYEILLNLASSLQHWTIDNFLTIVFLSRLQRYLHVTTTCMKRKTLQQYKETTLVCDEGTFEVKAINNLSIPLNSKNNINS